MAEGARDKLRLNKVGISKKKRDTNKKKNKKTQERVRQKKRG